MQKEGIETGLFEAGSVEQRQIEAGADLTTDHVARAADLLSALFETLWGQHVGDRTRDERGPDGVGDLPGAGLPATRITVHRVPAPGRGELSGGFTQDDIDARIRRSYECRKELGRRVDAAPERWRKDVHLDGMLGDGTSAHLRGRVFRHAEKR